MNNVFPLTVCVCVALAGASAQVDGPFELPKRFARMGFPQVPVADCSLPFGHEKARPATNHRVGRMTVRVSSRIHVEGKDNSNHPWMTEIEARHGGCPLWRADLDRDGQQDLIALTSDATSSGKSILTLLLMDSLGRPSPWQTVGHFDMADQGLANLVDLDRDGRAELLFLHVTGIDRGQAEATIPGGVRGNNEPDLTTALEPSAPNLTITGLVPGRLESCGFQIPMSRLGAEAVDAAAADSATDVCYDKMTLSDGRTVKLPAIVVLEKPKVRELAIYTASRLVREARMLGFSVQLSGQICDGSCRPFLMWASTKR